ncbi:MAG: pyridoxal kinase PdxY [Rhizobiaceae bacterium]
MTKTTLPSIISISSHVVRGAVGNRASVFALEQLGFAVWSVPTVTLPWHPGHGRATRIVPDDVAFANLVEELAASPFLEETGAILTGYFGSPAQIEPVANLIRALKAKHPQARYLCDPVIGDAAGLYVPEATAGAIREHLLPLADVITPNRFELEWLAGKPLPDNNALADAALTFAAPTALVTSAHAMMAGSAGNLLVEKNSTMLIEHRLLDGPSNGLGDLTSALFLGRILKGETAETAATRATSSVFEIMASAAKSRADELQLAANASSLTHPMAMVQTRRLFRPVKRAKA